MSNNLCVKCGGGFGEYTAPEAKCTCNKTVTPKDVRDIKHELLLLEAEYLKTNGWKVMDYISLAEGYTWKAPTGDFPIHQAAAVDIQKHMERMTVATNYRDMWLNGITTTLFHDQVHSVHKDMKMQMAEMTLRQKIHY